MIATIAQRILLIFVALFLTLTGVAAANSEQMIDPVFGLKYDVRKVIFLPAPQLIKQVCRDLSKSRPKLWLFAKSEINGATYFLLSGLMNVFPDVEKSQRRPTVEIDELGIVVEIRGQECRSASADGILSGDFVFRSKVDSPMTINEVVIESLYIDLVKRYINAFGGKDSFLKELKRQHRDPSELDPTVKSYLMKYWPDAIQQSK